MLSINLQSFICLYSRVIEKQYQTSKKKSLTETQMTRPNCHILVLNMNLNYLLTLN